MFLLNGPLCAQQRIRLTVRELQLYGATQNTAATYNQTSSKVQADDALEQPK